MKKLMVLILTIFALFCFSAASFGLNSPGIAEGDGVITGMAATDDLGLITGFEYGISPKFAVLGNISLGDNDFTKLAVKYHVSKTGSIVGGVYDSYSSSDPFVGFNGSLNLDRKISGILEADVVMNDDLYVVYEIGLIYDLEKTIDIRAGFLGSTHKNSDTAFELGVGYKF